MFVESSPLHSFIIKLEVSDLMGPATIILLIIPQYSTIQIATKAPLS